MLVDDSAVARAIFERILTQTGNVDIIFQAENSDDALTYLGSNAVDIILLDIEMPQRSGLDALPEIIAAAGKARILIVSSLAVENGPAAVRALSLGACDTLVKPGRSGFSGRFSQILCEKVIRLGQAEKPHTASRSIRTPSTQDFVLKRPDCIAIGASTGGIPVIFDIISALNPDLDCPIFITQHLPQAFMSFFAGQLSTHTNRAVHVAQCGVEVEPNTIYIAPGDAHLIFRRVGGHVYIDHLNEYSDTRYCPSVDAMIQSIADVYQHNALAIVLSGMGNDGLRGVRQLKIKLGQVIVQDESSSVVWGMPGAIAREGIPDAILSSSQISMLLSQGIG